MGEKGNTIHKCVMSGNTEAAEKSKAGNEREYGGRREQAFIRSGWESPLQSGLVSHAKECTLDFKAKGLF